MRPAASLPARCALALGILLAGGPLAAQQRMFGLIGEPQPLEATLPATLPPLSAARLIAIDSGSRHRVEIDALSLAVDQERLVRYSLLVTTAGGARNLTYEALRCDTRERRVLAVARRDDSWSVTPDSPWRPVVRANAADLHHAEIAGRLCEGAAAASIRPERLVERLQADLTRRY
jgi:hypothetical protein